MSRREIRRLLTNVVGLGLILLALSSLHNQGNHLNQQSQAIRSQQQTISTQQKAITDERASLAKTQNLLLTSVKRSAETRVTTVTQRCDFTRLVLNVLVQRDPAVSGPFHKSLDGCLVQLKLVKKIAAAAPGAPTQ